MIIDLTLLLLVLAGALTFVVAFPVVADPRYWTREGWNWWLVALGLGGLGANSFAAQTGLLPEDVHHNIGRVLTVLFVFLVWHRVWLLFTARREVERARHNLDRHYARQNTED